MRSLCLGLLVWAALTVPAEGQAFRWLAFGDSITEGWSDTPFLGGYPGRLQSDLNCTPSTCEVFNAGLSSEDTAGGVSRIDRVFNNNGPFDVLLLMEGTNDVWRLSPISNSTILFNLNTMASKAESRGTEAVLASTIWLHPGGKRGTTRDAQIRDLSNRIANSAFAASRLFVDPWSVLCYGLDSHEHTQSQCFNSHYWMDANGLPDVVGHPDGSGFRLLADEFFRVINSTPWPSPPSPNTPSGQISDTTPTLIWTKENPKVASWYRVRITGPGGTPFDEWVKASQVCSGNTCSTDVTSSLIDGNYSWQVMSRTARGRSGWSAQRSFEVKTEVVFGDGFQSGATSAWSETIP